MRRFIVPVLITLCVIAAAYAWRQWAPARPIEGGGLVLYGNVEIRQVDLAFGVDGPIAQMLVDEGDRVEPGQRLAVLDQDAFRFAEQNAAAALQAAEAHLAELVAGSRVQEIERSRASVAAAEASLENATTLLVALHRGYDSLVG